MRKLTAARWALGLYLAIYLALIFPFAQEIYADIYSNVTIDMSWFPNVLALFPSLMQATLAILIVLAVLFAGGWHHRLLAFILWYGWACLFNLNVLTEYPSLPYIGWLLLAFIFVEKKHGVLGIHRWVIPGAWAILGLGYTISGWEKLHSSLWLSGKALEFAMSTPLATSHVFVVLPSFIFTVGTYLVLALQLSSAPLYLWRQTRNLSWLAMVIVHILTILMLNLTQVSLGMLVFHLFVMDEKWYTHLASYAQKFFARFV